MTPLTESETTASQQTLRSELLDELEWEPKLGASTLDVTVGHDGVVTLTGVVQNYAQKVAAERAVKRVKGVHVVVNDVDVKLPSAHERTDVDLAQAVAEVLEWDVLVPHQRIRASVSDGWVRLEGAVEWNYQRTAAEEAVHRLTGVRGVTNRITVQPPVADEDVQTRAGVREGIRAALERSAAVEAKGVEVEAHQGRIALRGEVRSWAEREAALAAAWAAPGVVAVDDQLQIRA
ncbi:MAG TPA: BON domain-containing protein [Gemmatimonadales bacterium]|nr:BON domain-containing protein [Gemmatimonadales bacterium]